MTQTKFVFVFFPPSAFYSTLLEYLVLILAHVGVLIVSDPFPPFLKKQLPSSGDDDEQGPDAESDAAGGDPDAEQDEDTVRWRVVAGGWWLVDVLCAVCCVL